MKKEIELQDNLVSILCFDQEGNEAANFSVVARYFQQGVTPVINKALERFKEEIYDYFEIRSEINSKKIGPVVVYQTPKQIHREKAEFKDFERAKTNMGIFLNQSEENIDLERMDEAYEEFKRSYLDYQKLK